MQISDETRVIIANGVGMLVLALGMFGVDVPPEMKTELIAGLAAVGCLINAGLAAWETRKQ